MRWIIEIQTENGLRILDKYLPYNHSGEVRQWLHRSSNFAKNEILNSNIFKWEF